MKFALTGLSGELNTNAIGIGVDDELVGAKFGKFKVSGHRVLEQIVSLVFGE